MGELARVDGLKIKMYPFDTQKHKEPHIHVIQPGGRSASVSIASGRILEGELERNERRIVMSWMLANREAIWDRWNKAVSGNWIERIDAE